MPLWLRKTTKVRHVSVVSLNGSLDRPLHEAAKLKPGLPWRPEDIRNARAMAYLPRKAANRKWNQIKGKKHVLVNKAKRSWRS